ncbi:MAG TPA: carboxypeptidase-like regulatory domain-containing protein [Candidatus Thermoplasmatota archaeon]|nr:carboxypeptidase-like regulatory domain-containing protein [Candidatus Thermoplasmatota archaeon]
MANPRAVLVVLAGSLLAGCASGGGPDAGVDPEAGAARILVLDEALRPLAGVNVTLAHGGEDPLLNVTDADGVAGFSGLEPGAYVAGASLKGYDAFQTALTVLAGEPEPPFTRLDLARQAVETLAFYEELKIDGYVEFSASFGNWGGIANYYPCFVMQTAGQQCTGNLTNDRSLVEVPSIIARQRIPEWLQVEMVWTSTQAVSPYLETRIDISPPDDFLIANSTFKIGPSPLLVVYPPEWFLAWGLGVNHTLALEAFHGGPQAVCDADPTGRGGCLLVGVAAEQRFTWFLHTFYGYQPPEGWRFTSDGSPPPA